MNKHFLLAAALLAGAAAVQAPTATSTPADTARTTEQGGTTVSRQFTSRKPAPTKQTSQPVAQRQVAYQAQPLFPALVTRFIEKPHLCKVKYGKRRWVMV